ncbi:hypothetical protein [Anaerocolumna sp. MB42-C2]|uniref:hypothetical protein n=1 Tax=Anaerocolumna sp. MB42-C2 TaxID=3070997 RepID=UPI0027E0FB06|nr:hypothetical protein [Anaerocolumna sp. MB42-C2]WMJ89443.1 hypothetical protein RBU59_07940 [Anaerocolumna sp. MB42-C2]
MPYKFCSQCGAVHRKVSRVCYECGYPMIITNKNMQALAQKLYECDFNVLAATSTISDTSDISHKSVRLSIEFREHYDIKRVFCNLPDGWTAYYTFSLHDAIVIDDIVELNCGFIYYYMGFCSVEDEIATEIGKMMDWLSNDAHIAVLRLSGFFL